MSVFLFWTAGGFPPQMWRLLLQTLPQIPHLWVLKGPSMVLPVAALLLLSLSLFVAWAFLAALIAWMALQQWQYRRERQHFEDTLQKAQELATQDDADQQWWYEQTEPMQHVVPRRAGKLHFNGNAGVALLEPQPPAAGGHQGPSPTSAPPPPLRETYGPGAIAGDHKGPMPVPQIGFPPPLAQLICRRIGRLVEAASFPDPLPPRQK